MPAWKNNLTVTSDCRPLLFFFPCYLVALAICIAFFFAASFSVFFFFFAPCVYLTLFQRLSFLFPPFPLLFQHSRFVHVHCCLCTSFPRLFFLVPLSMYFFYGSFTPHSRGDIPQK